MTASLLFENLVSWSAQVLVLVGVAAIAALALAHPRARLLFWQGVLVIAVLLPFIQPWHRPPAPIQIDAPVVLTPTRLMFPEALTPQTTTFHWDYLLPILALGSIVRLALLALGVAKLNRRRFNARPLVDPPVPFQATNVGWYISDQVSGPATFGWLRPSILLPARFLDLPPALREAIASHELIHVLRNDWLATFAGEIVRGLLWFHPAIWYVLSQLQLAREQVVDLEVVRLTRDRRRYLDALVAVAAQSLQPDVAPAPLFLKKRQLAVRVAAILKERSMSLSRLVASLAAAGSVAAASAVLAIWLFPIQAPAQSPQATPLAAIPPDGPGVIVDPGGRLMHRTPVFYPRGAKSTGMVLLEASVNSTGDVTDVRVLSGPDDLRKVAIQNVLQWHYNPVGGIPPTIRVAIQFNQAPAEPSTGKGAQVPRPPIEMGRLTDIDVSGLPEDVAREVRDHLGVQVGDDLTSEKLTRVNAAVHGIDQHIVVNVQTNSRTDGPAQVKLRITAPGVGVSGGVVGGVISEVPRGVPGGIVTGSSTPEGIADPQRIRVGGNVQSVNLIRRVVPAYPPLAKQARIQGVVKYNAVIGKDGSILNLTLVSGHPLLVQPATDAVRQWLYKPTLLNGEPVEVITTIDVNFTLSDEPVQQQQN